MTHASPIGSAVSTSGPEPETPDQTYGHAQEMRCQGRPPSPSQAGPPAPFAVPARSAAE
jgi:hypothetical protein